MTKPNGLLSSDNPYSCRDEIEKWLAWDTAWHKLALEVADSRQKFALPVRQVEAETGGCELTPDYAEILRLHRKYCESDSEPLWKVFVRIGQRLEKAKPERCKGCFRTALEYSRLVDVTCDDPFHTTAPKVRGYHDCVECGDGKRECTCGLDAPVTRC